MAVGRVCFMHGRSVIGCRIRAMVWDVGVELAFVSVVSVGR